MADAGEMTGVAIWRRIVYVPTTASLLPMPLLMAIALSVVSPSAESVMGPV